MSQALLLNQLKQLENPDAKIVLGGLASGQPLSHFAKVHYGSKPGQTTRVTRSFWELPQVDAARWIPLESTPDTTAWCSGKSKICLRPETAALEGVTEFGVRGSEAWGKPGVILAQMSELQTSLYVGKLFDNNTRVIQPADDKDLAALVCFLESSAFLVSIRALNQKLDVSRETFEQVPFDLNHWQKVSEERYPNGLPEPYSDDPTQWLFHGDIPSSTDPLQVAVAKLLGYQWPDQSEGPLDRHADEDGIVTLAPLVNQDGIAGRLRALLQSAYEFEAPARPIGAPEPEEPRIWNEAVIPNLLTMAGSTGISFEEWLRDKFFEAHCKLFQQLPFIWHIWDGRKDGFHAFLNYHKLDRKNLERLTHVYLGEWIERQRAASDSGDRTADARLIAAQELQKKLELIRTGAPPYDIFVRWKTLAEQPMGWDPDLNDGVRMNIRPFVEAGILRGRVNVNWNKDRGRDPKPNLSGTDERHNDLHFTLAEKRAAREAKP